MKITSLYKLCRFGRIGADKSNTIIDWVLAVLVIYSNGTWFSAEFGSIAQLLLLCTIGTKIFVLSEAERLRFPNYLVAILAVFPFVSALYNSYNPLNVPSLGLNAILYASLSMLPISHLRSVLSKCASVIFFLAIPALVVGSITLTNYSWLHRFPMKYNDNFFGGYYNLVIYTDRYINDFRVQSIFWEPGVWAFHLAFALYWKVNVQRKWASYPIFLASFALALSTTGMILVAIHYAGTLMVSKKNTAFLVGAISPFILGATLILSLPIIDQAAGFPVSEFAYDATVGKIANKEASISYLERKESTDNAFRIALENPVFGIGKQNVESAVFVTSALAQTSYQLGFFYTVFVVLLMWRFHDKMGLIAALPYTLAWLNGEAVIFSALCSLILTYSAKMPLPFTRAYNTGEVHVTKEKNQ